MAQVILYIVNKPFKFFWNAKTWKKLGTIEILTPRN